MTTTTTTPRRLHPVADNIYHGGAPHKYISPTKGMRNAALIYEAIKNMPDKNLVRGDFNKASAPFIFFPERPKKKIGQSKRVGVIEEKNIESGRKEFSAFLQSIADTVYTSANPKPNVMGAVIDLQVKSRFIMGTNQDFKIADIKEPLRVLKNAYYTEEIYKKATLHRLLGREDTKIQSKRFREFIKISGENFSRLCASLKPPTMDKYATAPQTAVFAMKVMIRRFLDHKNENKKSFSRVIRENATDPDILFFAKRWVEILKPESLKEKGKGPSKERIILNTESWAKEFDKICPMILKAKNRGYRTQDDDVSGGGQPLYQRSSSLYLQSMPQLGTPLFFGLSADLPYSSLIVDSEDESSLVMSSTVSSMGSKDTRVTGDKAMSKSSTVSSLPSRSSSGYIAFPQHESNTSFVAWDNELADLQDKSALIFSPSEGSTAQFSFSDTKSYISEEPGSPALSRLNAVRKTLRDDFFNFSSVALPDPDEAEAITETVPKFIRETSASSATALSVNQMDELLSPADRKSVSRIVSMEGSGDTSEASATEESL